MWRFSSNHARHSSPRSPPRGKVRRDSSNPNAHAPVELVRMRDQACLNADLKRAFGDLITLNRADDISLALSYPKIVVVSLLFISFHVVGKSAFRHRCNFSALTDASVLPYNFVPLASCLLPLAFCSFLFSSSLLLSSPLFSYPCWLGLVRNGSSPLEWRFPADFIGCMICIALNSSEPVPSLFLSSLSLNLIVNNVNNVKRSSLLPFGPNAENVYYPRPPSLLRSIPPSPASASAF